MTLEKLEQYLDGSLPAEEARTLEAAAAADGVLAARIQRLRSQRALRQAALSTYSPTEAESQSLSASTLAACYPAVVGRVGFKWVRAVGAIAAMLVIAATSFYAGRVTNPVSTGSIQTAAADKEVLVIVPGETEAKHFPTVEAAQEFVDGYQTEQQAQVEDDRLADSGVL